MHAPRSRPSRPAIARLAAIALAALCLGSAALAVQSPSKESAPAVAPAAPAQAPVVADCPDSLPRVLVFSRTTGFRHLSIPDGIAAIRALGTDRWCVDATEDPAVFTADNLRRYRAVVFLSTTGNVLDDAQQKAFEEYIRAGNGWVGIHAAADTEYEWPWYGKLVGAWFKGHPRNQQATVNVEDRTHRSTAMLPAEWKRLDEWYSFRSNPRSDVRVLASLDEKSYDPEKVPMGDHPIAWYHEFDGGRAWYTALGHTKESYAEKPFLEHVREGIEWAAGIPAKAGPANGAAPAAPATPAPAAKPAAALRGERILAQAPAMLAAIPTSIMLGGAFLIAAIMLGSTGQGVKGPILNWVFPGLGHIALGYRRRGVIAMVAILGMFAGGLLIGGLDAVDSVEDAPWYIAQSANGPIAFAADLANQQLLKKGKVGELLPAPSPTDPSGGSAAGQPYVSTFKGIGAANEFGTLFIALGGMMNFILVMDISRRERAESPND
ncbi:MAG: ThuA domain-containing protein [Proteobacteria bacterium]|nr:ThuA domain-containing protein [Pseudomonadota bacterium]